MPSPHGPSNHRPSNHGPGPYRSAPLPYQKRSRRLLLGALGALVVIGAAFLLLKPNPEHGPSAEDAAAFASPVHLFPALPQDLRVATPLAPLLAADGPEDLAMVRPAPGAMRLRRGELLHVRFNRPMVARSAVGRLAEPAPVYVMGRRRVEGEVRWVTRSALTYLAPDYAWDRGLEGELRVADDLTGLDGSPLRDGRRRSVVFDRTPHVISRGLHRVGAGAPLPMYFDNQVALGELQRETLVYEIGGGARSVPFSLRQRGRDGGRFRVDIVPRRPLEAGVSLGVALSPRWWSWAGASPGVMRYQVQPPPQVEGIACEGRYCRHEGAPGQIVDIEQRLSVRASENLASAVVQIVPRVPNQRVRVEGADLHVEGDWATDQVYEVRITNMVTAQGESVAAIGALAVRSRGRAPSVRFVGVGQTRLAFEAGAEPVLDLAGINVAKGAVLRRELDSLEAMSAATLHPQLAIQNLHHAAHMTPLDALLPDARSNAEGTGTYTWRNPGDASAALVGLRAGEGGTRAVPFVFQQSDLALTVHAYEGEALVWVTRVSSAEPVAGAHVLLEDSRGRVRGETDSDGLVQLAAPRRAETHEDPTPMHQRRFAVAAERGDERAVALFESGVAMGPAQLGVFSGGIARADLRATLGTDRGVYRPGTAVHVVGVLREGDELATAANVDLRIELTHPSRTRPLAEKSLRSSARGGLAARLPLPEDAPLGGCTLRLIAGEDDEVQVLATATVRIDLVRPPTFRVDLSGPAQVRSGDPLAVQVDAAFLFGAPLRDAELRWALLRQGNVGAPQAYADYDFGPVDADYAHRTEAEGIARTDEHGQATIELGILSTGGWERLALEVEAVDRSGQSVTAHHRVTLMASALRPGLRRGDAFIDGRLEAGGTPLEVDALVLDAAGERVSGAALSARIVREGWHRWWEWRGGALQPRRQHQAEEVFRCAFAAVDDACAYTPERSGTYVIEVRVRDEDGKEALASRRVYVAGPDEAPDRDPPGAPIALTPRQPTLRVGETAELALESPWPGGEMLITVSRDTILHTERRRLSAGSQIVRFAITEAMVPNAFVTASLVKPRTGEPRLGRSRAGRGSRTIDPGAPDLRIGATEIAVRPLSSELPLRIEAPESAPAGERVEVVVYTDAEVSLFAVDERLLRLDGHELGDLAAGLWGRDGAAFGIEDLRRTLRARRVREDLRRGGDGGGEGAARVLRAKDRLSRPVPLWAAGIPAEDGVVRRSFELPEGAATYRIIALAIGDGAAVRHVQAELQATTDVVIEGQLPTFATEGDQFDARFVVHATGRDLADEFVAHVGNETVRRTLNLAQGESETVSVAVTIQGAAGSALDVRAQVGGASFERALPVAARGRWTHTRAFGAGAEPTTLRFPEGAVGQLRLTASRAPLLGAESIAQRISQSAWRDLPTRAAAAIALAAGDGAFIDADERQARLNRAAERLVALQQSDGSFYRTTNAYATPWQSVLGAHALYELHEAGADVPEDALARSRSWLQDVINRAPFGDGDYADRDSGLAHAIYTLSRYGEWSPSVADSLFARREQLSLTARAWLALAYLSSNDEEASVLLHEVLQYLTKDVSADTTLPPSVRYAERRGAMLGPVLAALSEEPALASRAAPIAEQLFAETRHGHLGWRSPVDAAFALFGLRVYAERFESGGVPSCTLDGTMLEPAETGAGAQRFILNVAELAGEDRILQPQGGPVFYVLEADFAEPLAHEDRAARGNAAALHRRFERLNGGVLSRGDSVPLGAMIRVRLFTHSESGAQQTQLFDPLAAGWQALEGQLQTAPASALRSMLGMGPEDDAMDPRGYYAARSVGAIESRRAEGNAVLFALSHLPRGLQEFTYVVRATTPGRFSIPPATLEERRGRGVLARSSDFELHVAELAETEER